MTDADLKSLVDLCQKHGIRRIKTAEVELEFGPAASVDPAELKQWQDMIDKGMPSDEEALFWSVQGPVPQPEQPPEIPKTTRQRRAAQ